MDGGKKEKTLKGKSIPKKDHQRRTRQIYVRLRVEQIKNRKALNKKGKVNGGLGDPCRGK